MVSTFSILMMVLTLLICFGLPVTLLIFLHKKEQISIKAVLVGVSVFLISQVFIRIPILNYVSAMEWYQQMASNIFLLAVFLSVTAGLFEETGRYLGFRFPLKKYLSWKNAVAFGIGHGGIEAIVLTGFTYINNLIYSLSINNGSYENSIAPLLGPEAAAFIRDQLVSLPPYMYLVAGLERAFTVFIHIALSLVVLSAVVRGRKIYLILAVLLHALVNFPVVMIPGLGFSVLYVELYLLALAIVSIVWILRSRDGIPEPSQSDNGN